MQDHLADLGGSGDERRHPLGEPGIEGRRIVDGHDGRGIHVRSELRDQPAPRGLVDEVGHDQAAGVIERGHHVVEPVR